jgi:hypothetical protein
MITRVRGLVGSGVALLTISIVVVLAGCAGRKALDQVRGDFPCATPVVEESVANEIRKITGCGTENVYGWDGNTSKWRSVTERAVFDMSCPRDQLTVHHLGGAEVGVEGCGKKAVFVGNSVCGGGACSFRGWVLNSTQN